MSVIYKYELRITDRQEIAMSYKAKLLSVQMQAGKLMLWALVEPAHHPVKRVLTIHGTGHHGLSLDNAKYVGTAQDPGGLVWHVFDHGSIT